MNKKTSRLHSDWNGGFFSRSVWWAETFQIASSMSLTSFFFCFILQSVFLLVHGSWFNSHTEVAKAHTFFIKEEIQTPADDFKRLAQTKTMGGWGMSYFSESALASSAGLPGSISSTSLCLLSLRRLFLPAWVSLSACFRPVTSSTSLYSLPLPSVTCTDRLKSVLCCWERSMKCRKIKTIHNLHAIRALKLK